MFKLSEKTIIEINKLIIKDIENQLEQLKNQKDKFEYSEYRYRYVRLHNNLQWRKKNLSKFVRCPKERK